MSLKLYFHPLSSYCQKVLIALYENSTLFEPQVVDLGDPRSSAELRRLWPMAKFPVLRDEARDRTVAESSIIIEYLGQHYPGGVPLLPADPDSCLQVRFADRFFDLYVHNPMQQIVGDRLRPAEAKDPYGVEAAMALLHKAYDMIEAGLATRSWAAGDSFSLADCAAGPPLFFAKRLVPFGGHHGRLATYFDRLCQRPSYARALAEAEPFLRYFPG
jgi:glutathione S-transferase